MVISANEIKDEESLEQWLDGQSTYVANVIATRGSLRSMPIAMESFKNFEEPHALSTSSQLILTVFRANFTSWAACKYPALNMKSSASNAQVASATTQAIKSLFFVCDTEADINSVWQLIRNDAQWIEMNIGHTNNLLSQRLFLPTFTPPETEAIIEQRLNSVWHEFHLFAFSKAPENIQRPLTLIAAWYGALLPTHGKPRSMLGEELDMRLASQQQEFWEGNPIEVLNKVADLVDWLVPVNETPVDTNEEELSIEENAFQPNYQDLQDTSAGKIDPKMVSQNRATIALNLESILLNIKSERELLGDQPNEEEKQQEWNRKSDFLNHIEAKSKDSLDLLFEDKGNTPEANDKKVALLLEESLATLVDILRSNNRIIIEETLRSTAALSLISLLSWVGVPVLLGSIAIFAQTSSDKTWKKFTGIFPDIWNRTPPPE